MSPEEIRERAEKLGPWFHNLVLNGVPTAPAHFLGDYPAVKFERFAAAVPADLTGKSVLDIGCGGGAGSIPLADVAGRLVGVDESEQMLESYERAAAATAVPDIATVRGTWPAVAPQVETADVVVLANVVYNVQDLVPFVLAAHEHARHRVVVELTVAHPQVPISALWRHFHGQDRPSGPRLADFVSVLAELGIAPVIWRWDRPPYIQTVDPSAYVAWVRRRLCLPYEREPEVVALLAAQPLGPVPVATVWWDTAG